MDDITTAKRLGLALRTIEIIEADLVSALSKGPAELHITAEFTLAHIKQSKEMQEELV